jgi:mRNA-degrading endonuclease RelE of RelBE toxin-antitoxin system
MLQMHFYFGLTQIQKYSLKYGIFCHIIFSMVWIVQITRKATKQAKKLNTKALTALQLLVEEMKLKGPAPGKQWPNYGKLKGQMSKQHHLRHYHLTKGQPTYVCCWEVKDKTIKLIEVYYVGTHEKAPY